MPRAQTHLGSAGDDQRAVPTERDTVAARNNTSYIALSKNSSMFLSKAAHFFETSSKNLPEVPASLIIQNEKHKTLGANALLSCVEYYANELARKFATLLVVAVTRDALSSRSNTG